MRDCQRHSIRATAASRVLAGIGNDGQ
jgi:hypothetical protein